MRFLGGLQGKFLIFFLILDLSTLGIMIGSVSRKGQFALTSKIQESLFIRAEETANVIEKELAVKWKSIQDLSVNSFIRNSVIDSLGRNEYLKPFMHKLTLPGKAGNHALIALLDFKGRVIAKNRLAGAIHLDPNVLQKVFKEGAPQFQWAPGGVRPGLIFVFPVFYQQYVEGAIVCEFDLSFADEVISEHKEYKTVLVDSSHNALAGQLPEDVVVHEMQKHHDQPADHLLEKGGVLYAVKSVDFSPPFNRLDWHMVLSVPKSEVFSTVDQMRKEMYQVGFLTAFFLSLIILWRARAFVRPLENLKVTMEEIMRQGNLTQRVRVPTHDEVGQLAETFNQMLGSLHQRAADKQKLEKQLLRSEKMSAVGQLAAGVAHEINNPLGIILGFAQSVVRRLKDGDPMTMPLKSIEQEAIRCKNLVQDLLMFSRKSETQRMEELDIKPILDGTLSLVWAQCKVNNVELIKEYAPALPKIFGNSNQIQQVIINLSNNAIDAMPRGGTLTLRVQLSKESPESVEIRVQDTGTGVPKEIQSRIFEPFYTTKDVGKGTGLGLSLIYEIVQTHKGSIELESEEGKGATFKVKLPAVPLSDAVG